MGEMIVRTGADSLTVGNTFTALCLGKKLSIGASIY